MDRFELLRTERWQGEVHIYRDRVTGQHYAASRADTFDHGDETLVFVYDEAQRKVADWREVAGGTRMSHAEAMQRLADRLT